MLEPTRDDLIFLFTNDETSFQHSLKINFKKVINITKSFDNSFVLSESKFKFNFKRFPTNLAINYWHRDTSCILSLIKIRKLIKKNIKYKIDIDIDILV